MIVDINSEVKKLDFKCFIGGFLNWLAKGKRALIDHSLCTEKYFY